MYRFVGVFFLGRLGEMYVIVLIYLKILIVGLVMV